MFHGDAEWHGTAWRGTRLPCQGERSSWGGSICCVGGPVGERSALIWDLRAFPLVLWYFPRRLRNGSCERGCEGNVDSEEVELKWFKESYLS